MLKQPNAIGKKKKHNFKTKHTKGGEEGERGAIPHGYTSPSLLLALSASRSFSSSRPPPHYHP
eukprot:6612029-Pyramimonas_sp.AAC.1